MSGERIENRNIAIVIGIASIIFVVCLGTYWTYYIAQDVDALKALNDQIHELTNYKSKLETWLAGNITQLQSRLDSLNATYQDYASTHTHMNSEYDSLRSDYDNYVASHHHIDLEYDALKSPRLIGILSAEDPRPADELPYLHIFGNVVNTGKDNASDALLFVEAFQGQVLAFNTTVSLGTINGESFAAYVDGKVSYLGDALTTWHIWSKPNGIDWRWYANT